MEKNCVIINRSSGMILGVDRKELKAGTIISTYTRDSLHNDAILQWCFDQNTGTVYCGRKYNDKPNFCMELRDGRILVLGEVDDSKVGQKWKRDGSCIKSESNKDLILGIAEKETNIKMANQEKGNDKQMWIIRNAIFHGTKTYYIMASKKNGMALGVETDNPKLGAKIPSYILDDKDPTQQWCFDQSTETIRCKLNNDLCMELMDKRTLALRKFEDSKPEQKWKRRGKYIQSCANDGMTLHISEAKLETDSKTTGVEKQKWNFRNAFRLENKNFYTIANKFNGLALGIPQDVETIPGAKVSAYELVYGDQRMQWWIDESTATIRCKLKNDLCIEMKDETTLVLGVFDRSKLEQQWKRKDGYIRSRANKLMVLDIHVGLSGTEADKTSTETLTKTEQQRTIQNVSCIGRKTYYVMDSKFNNMALGVGSEDPRNGSEELKPGTKIVSYILAEGDPNLQWCFDPNTATVHCKRNGDLCMEVTNRGRSLTLEKLNDSKTEQKWTRHDGYIQSYANPRITLHISEIKENLETKNKASDIEKLGYNTVPETSSETRQSSHCDATPPKSEPEQNIPPETLSDLVDQDPSPGRPDH